MNCLHCKEVKRIRGRGLCYGCYVRHGRDYPIRMNGNHHPHVLPECMACGEQAPNNFLQKNGWYTRDEKVPSVTVKVVICPACFALYGWGDEVSSVAPYSPFEESEIPESGPRVHTLHGRARARAMGLRM